MTTMPIETTPKKRNRKLNDKQKKFIDTLVDEYCTSGVAPTTTRATVLGEYGNATSRQLACLSRKGYFRQPYPSGPWRPLKDSKGNPVIMTAVVKSQVA